MKKKTMGEIVCLTRSVRYVVNRSIRHDAPGWFKFFRMVSKLFTGTVRFGSEIKAKEFVVMPKNFSVRYSFEWYRNISHNDWFLVSTELVLKVYSSVVNELWLQSNVDQFVYVHKQNLRNRQKTNEWFVLISDEILPWESRLRSSSLINSIDEWFIANNSCLIELLLERISSDFFLCTRFFLVWLLERIAAAAISAHERFFERIIPLVSILLLEEDNVEGTGLAGVVFSMETFDMVLWRDLRICLLLEEESNCS